MMSAADTNMDKYSIPESRVQRDNSGEGSLAPYEEPLALASRILKYPLPKWYSMNDVYRRVAKQLPLHARADTPSDTGESEYVTSFDTGHDLDALARAHSESRDSNTEDLTADFWPEDESVEDFIDAATEGRYEEEEDDPDS